MLSCILSKSIPASVDFDLFAYTHTTWLINGIPNYIILDSTKTEYFTAENLTNIAAE